MTIEQLIKKYEQEINRLEKSKQDEQTMLDNDDYNDRGESENYIGYCCGRIEQLTETIKELKVILNDKVDEILIK